MKKFYAAIVILLILAHGSKAQDMFTQYFDGADTVFEYSINVEMDTSSQNIWQIGSPLKIIFDSAATAPNAIITDARRKI